MDENDQEKTSYNPVTAESKLWLPSSYTNGNAPLTIGKTSNQKKTGNRWGFSGKTGWDWLNLLGVLAIPFVIAAGTLFFTQQITLQQALLSEKQHQTDIRITVDQQQAAILQNYLDYMSDLLLNQKLSEPKPGYEVREVARSRTLTTLQLLNSARKGIILQFLAESRLIFTPVFAKNIVNNPIIDLSGANLSGADMSSIQESGITSRFGAGLTGADLMKVNLDNANLNSAYLNESWLFDASLKKSNLSRAILSGASLSGADLSNADLQNAFLGGAILAGVNLSGANLQGVDLSGANLRGAMVTQEQLAQASSLKGATMPDGSIHP